MSFLPSHSRLAAMVCAGALLAGTATAGATGTDLSGARVHGHPAGQIGTAVTIAHAQDLPGDHPDDVAVAPDGTAYIGWIADTVGSNTDRAVHLCTLPVAAKSCLGGVRTIPTDGASTADDLHVLLTHSGATLVWFHNTANAINGPDGGAIAEASASQDGTLTAEGDIRSAPSFGELLDAEFARDGSLWTLTYTGVGSRALQLDEGPSTTVKLRAPYNVGEGQIAFTSGPTAVLAVSKYGAISSNVAFAKQVGGRSWSSFSNVAGTWTNAGFALTATGRGLRLITGVDNASYRPVIARWNGAGFDRRALTSDKNNCAPSTHDGASDASGRLLDASWECNDVTIANYADDAHSAVTRFFVGGTPTYAPQVGAGVRGIATVLWSVEDKAGGSVLRASRVRLATASRTVTGHARGGAVHLTGPVSCLSPSNTPVRVSATHAHGWRLVHRSLTLGSASVGSTIDGAALDANRKYTLHGAAVFGKGGKRSTARVGLVFRTC